MDYHHTKRPTFLKEKLKKLATYRWSKVMASFMGKSDLRDFPGNLLAIVDKCNHSCIKIFLFTITKSCSYLTNPTSSSTLKSKTFCVNINLYFHTITKSLVQRNYSENSTPIKYQVSFLCENILIIYLHMWKYMYM